MNSRRFPSGSRTYTLDASARRPPSRATGPSRSIAAPASSSSACSDSGDPSHTKQRSPHGGRAFGRAQREALALPRRGTMEVDHLVADVDRHHVRMLGDVEPERAVERDHRVGVLHRQRHVVEPATAHGHDSYGKPYSRAQLVAVILRRSAAGSVPSVSSIASASSGTCCRCADSPTPTCTSRRRGAG